MLKNEQTQNLHYHAGPAVILYSRCVLVCVCVVLQECRFFHRFVSKNWLYFTIYLVLSMFSSRNIRVYNLPYRAVSRWRTYSRSALAKRSMVKASFITFKVASIITLHGTLVIITSLISDARKMCSTLRSDHLFAVTLIAFPGRSSCWSQSGLAPSDFVVQWCLHLKTSSKMFTFSRFK